MMNLSSSNVPLDVYLEPLVEWLNDESVTEITINQPGEIWIETRDDYQPQDLPALTSNHLTGLAQLIAEYNEQDLGRHNPLLSGHLPNGCRVQIVSPPYCQDGRIGFSIRRQAIKDMSLNDYCCLGSATNAQVEILMAAIESRKNIVISGGTNTGKTTLLNALLKQVSPNERIITIEDARELKPPHDNQFNYIYQRKDNAHEVVNELLMSALRMRPDRIIAGELRGPEAYTFLRIIGSGHPGSMTSLHADTPALCFEQLALMVMQAGIGLGRSDIIEYVKAMIHVIVQVRRFPNGKRQIVEIYESQS